MPVSHIGLTVSHLPTSCSFFLSALQPLGYRFMGQQGNQIGLGINEADFFLCQETPGVKAGAAHIAFSAPSRTAVRDFYTAALNAGGRPHGSPSCRNEETGYFNAAILDFDGNSIEVVHREHVSGQDAASVAGQSRVLEWRGSVAENLGGADNRSVVSLQSAAKTAKALTAMAPNVAPSDTGRSAAPPPPPAGSTRSVSSPLVTLPERRASGDDSAKKIIGTLLGAAAGAAVAYAMCKGEQQSARDEAEAYAKHAQKYLPAPSEHQQPARLEYEPAPRSVHHDFAAPESVYGSRSYHGAMRAIEASPPKSYHSPTYASVAPSKAMSRAPSDYGHAIEYAPAASVANISRASTHRSVSSPSAILSPAKSATGKSTHSSFISDFIPPSETPRLISLSHHGAESSRSTTSSRKPPKSTFSISSKTSKAPSIPGTILGRGPLVDEPESLPPLPPSEIGDLDLDNATVVPEDSVSCAGSHRSHRSKRSPRHSSSSSSSHRRDSAHDLESSSDDRRSHASSHRSSRSHRSHRSSGGSSSLQSSHKSKSGGGRHAKARTVVSEASDASTVKPAGSGVGGAFRSVVEKAGSVASLPIRAITQSMVDGAEGKRSVASYAG